MNEPLYTVPTGKPYGKPITNLSCGADQKKSEWKKSEAECNRFCSAAGFNTIEEGWDICRVRIKESNLNRHSSLYTRVSLMSQHIHDTEV
jgi:hypothetical protein